MSDDRTSVARPTPAPAANGEMLNRVQQLRLGGQLGAGKTGGGGATWLPWVLCFLLAATWALVGIRGYRNPSTAPEPAGGDAPTPSGSTAAPANPASAAPAGTVQLEVKGYLVPASQIAVSPIDVAGRVVKLNVVEGKFYEKGAVLAQLDPTSFQAAVAEADATLRAVEQRQASAKQKLAEMTAVLEAEKAQVAALIEEARATRARTEAEWNRVNGLTGISQQERVQARTDWEATEARLKKLTADQDILVQGRPARIAAATADLAAAEADGTAAAARLTQAKWRLDNCTIRAPISGTALTKKAEEGNLVNPMAFAATSGSVCDMADLRDLEVDLKIPEREISKARVGQPCRIRADAYPGMVYAGRLDRIMPIANRSDNTVNVRVKVRLPDGEAPGTYLKPEMGAVVTFLPGDAPAQ